MYDYFKILFSIEYQNETEMRKWKYVSYTNVPGPQQQGTQDIYDRSMASMTSIWHLWLIHMGHLSEIIIQTSMTKTSSRNDY